MFSIKNYYSVRECTWKLKGDLQKLILSLTAGSEDWTGHHACIATLTLEATAPVSPHPLKKKTAKQKQKKATPHVAQSILKLDM